MPYDAFKTKDLYFVTGATNDKQFAIFTKQLGKPELASDKRFKTNDDRVKNRNELYPILKPLFLQKTTAELMGFVRGDWHAVWSYQYHGKGVQPSANRGEGYGA